MSGREVREYTNLSDPKDKKSGKGRIDDEDTTFQRMVAKMQDVAGERGGYLHGRGALDSDDLLYLKEQMEAEEDAERLLRRTEKRAFAAFKKAASIADSSPASLPLPLRVEPKPKSGIRQQDLLKKVVEVKPKRPRVSSPRDEKNATVSTTIERSTNSKAEAKQGEKVSPSVGSNKAKDNRDNPVKSLLVAYVNSDSDED
ncbi:Ankyrin repeat domain-containing protein 50 [Heracleum sosnowskyi]|uniref:Ankyrin repeat domain-containing protein 50 n=1 Tax=Heracleum sosnowskyi TaxID=360622 RepID=A0AAD8GMN9_9APIA|nr:Ankyrin repeat domain-containing protein 50 [Heracleum sosnowskyi]